MRYNRKALAAALVLVAISTLLFPSLSSLNSGFSVQSYGTDYTEVEFTIPEYEIITEEIDGVTYHKLIHFNAGYLGEKGLPEIAKLSCLIGVPEKGTVSIEEPKIKEQEVLRNINLFPSQGLDLDICPDKGLIIDEEFYLKDVDYPFNIASINTPGIMRDMRLVSLTLSPFSYNPARRELTVRKRMTVRVIYDTNSPGINEMAKSPRRLSRSFESLYRRNVINYEQVRNPGERFEYQAQSLLVVYNSSPTISSIIEQYVNWKRDKGFKVTAVSTQNLSTATALQNYIQNAYNTWDDPPEHIVLMGSGFNESLPVPYHLVNNLRGDYRYTLLAGDDDLPEAFIGRVSAADATGMATAWNKIRNYERTPYMVETDWYEHAMVVGDTAGGYTGVSAVIMAKLVKEIIKNYNNDYAVTEVLDAPFPAQMNNAINQGISYYSFRGAVGFAGWSPQDTALNNGFKLCHSTFLTCGTLDLEGGRRSEQFFRMGTPAVAKGGMSSVGMTTNSTTTAFNNCMTGGIYYGIFSEGVRTMGEALVEGKLNLYRVYGNMHAGQLPRFTQQTNLIGDSSLSIWGSVPKTLNVDYPETVPPGSNSIKISVTGYDDLPIEDAWVTIRQVGENAVYATGYTGVEGEITHFFQPNHTGTVRVTVTKPDHKTYLGEFEIGGTPAVSLHDVVFNDDLIAGSTVDFIVILKNHRQQQVSGVSAVISSDSPFVSVTTANSNYGNIAPGSNAESVSLYRIRLSEDTPAGHRAVLRMNVTDNEQNSWLSRISFRVENGNLLPVNYTIQDDDNGVLDPLEIADLLVHVRNTGSIDLQGIQGVLRGRPYGITIVDSTASFGNIAVDQTVTSTNNHFTLSASAYVLPGSIFYLDLILFNEAGFRQKRKIELTVGTVTVTDPYGPDSYGYWIYDIGDVGYIEAPVYEWIEICPDLGGPGVNTGLVTDHDNDQRVMTMDLPFTFKMYGKEYDVISICPNGWASPGGSEQAAFRNGRLPGNLGPKPIIAPMWENFSTAQGGVYTYYDEDENIFIIQWQNMLNVMQNAPNTFQAILYDPFYYYTTTFDGPIKFQYKVFNNVNNGANSPSGLGNWGNYASVGIADYSGTIGLEYTYNNRYPLAARPLGHETALYITTGLNSALVGVENYWINDGNNNQAEYGETFNVGLRLSNIGVEDAPGVSVIASTNDQYLTIIQNFAEFGDIEEGGEALIDNAFTMELTDNVPHRHRAIVNLLITSTDNLSWNYDLHIDAQAPQLNTLTPLVFDPQPGGNNNGMVDPGETITLYLPIINEGGADSPPVNVSLTTESPLVTIQGITEPVLRYIKKGELQYPGVNLIISEEATPGSGLRFNYTYTCGNYTFEGQFLLGLGGIIPVQLGTGNAATGTNDPSPINIYYRSLRNQMLYMAGELNEHGIFGEFPVNQLGFYVVSAPVHPLINFTIRMKHTTFNNLNNHDDGPFVEVYTAQAYSPRVGDWDMIAFNTPFVWNGIDNIIIDTSFSPVQGWSSSGQVRISEVPNSYRYTRSDSPDQRDQVTVSLSSNRPQVLLMMGIDPDNIHIGPSNLTAEFINQAVHLEWDPITRERGEDSYSVSRQRRINPVKNTDSYRNPDGYNIYRNGIKINEELVDDTAYDDYGFDGTVICYYYVTAVYGDNETLPSNIVAQIFDVVETPELLPASGVYLEPFLVSISTATPDVMIYYTTNGNVPTEDDYLYEQPFQVNHNTVVKAKAFREDWVASYTAVNEYTVIYPPQNLTGSGTTTSTRITWEDPWSPDDRENSRSTRLAGRNQNIPDFNRNTVLGYNIYRSNNEEEFVKLNEELFGQTEFAETDMPSGIYYYYVTAVYGVGESKPSSVVPVGVGYVTKPYFDPPPGEYNQPVEVRIFSHTDNVVILYTTNGADPNDNSSVYTGAPILLDEDTTLKAFAIRTDWMDSEIYSGNYIINITSVDDNINEPEILRTELLSAYPNPFNPSTTIQFRLKDNDAVNLEIYNIIGKKVKTLINGHILNTGKHSIVWNGDDDRGNKVSSGIYLYRLTTSDYSSVKKVVMIK